MSTKLRAGVLGLVCCLGVCPERTFAAESHAIYRCEQNGVLTFSDQPCGRTAELHESSGFATNTYEAPLAHTQPPSPGVSRSGAKPTQRAAKPKQREDSCARLEAALKKIRSTMRSGYSAAEGERLKERQAQLRARQRQARCS